MVKSKSSSTGADQSEQLDAQIPATETATEPAPASPEEEPTTPVEIPDSAVIVQGSVPEEDSPEGSLAAEVSPAELPRHLPQRIAQLRAKAEQCISRGTLAPIWLEEKLVDLEGMSAENLVVLEQQLEGR
jgi:hypothetical protein